MGKHKNRNKKKNRNKECMDGNSHDLYSNLKMSFESSNPDFCMDHTEPLNMELKSTCENHQDESFATAVTGTKPKISLQNFNKNVSGLNVNNQYEKQINGSIKKYEEKWDNFYQKYLVWRNERLNTISKLQELVRKVHDDQLAYNKTNMIFKELNVNSRILKDSNNSAIDFFASLGTFITDAASGITSIAQAFNVDVYNLELKKIMEDDAEITKSLYATRSECLEQYRDVEEVMQRFHSETLEETWETISKTLKFDDLWLDLKNTHGESLLSETVGCLDRFISKNANLTTFSKIYDSCGRIIDSNPAALNACKSAGKALYGIYDTWGRDQKEKKGITADISRTANMMILREEENELCQLRSIVTNSEMTQAKLESKIEDAIDSLQTELNEISNLFIGTCAVI